MPEHHSESDVRARDGEALAREATQLITPTRRRRRSRHARRRALDIPARAAARPQGPRPVAWLTTHGRRLEVSDLDRVLFRGEDIRKGDVLRYYSRIADTMLPHVRGRALACPASWTRPDGGVRDEERLPSWIRTVDIDTAAGRGTHLIADERASLTYLAQQGPVTLRATLARASAPRRPDCLLFDIDPIGSGAITLDAMCDAARLLRRLLEGLELVPFVMTTGSRGLHVRVPIVPEPGSEAAIPFSRHVVEAVVGLAPDRLAGYGMQPRHSRGAFITFRSTRTSMPVAPYALRRLPGAPVATPLDWDELDSPAGPSSCDISSIYARIESRGDPWARMPSSARSLAGALLNVAHQPVGGADGGRLAEA